MRELVLKILRRSILVAIALGLMGYFFAEAYLVLTQMNGAIADPRNEEVRWRAPLTMASFGVAILVFMEIVFHFIRRNQAVAKKLNGPPPPSTVAPNIFQKPDQPQ